MSHFYHTYIKSWDTGISIVLGIALYMFMPEFIKGTFAASFYNVGITVLSIIFSLFFAALAIIMSSTDNDFIMYLEEEKYFTSLMNTFKLVLLMLFLSLVYSIILYICTDFYLKEYKDNLIQPKIFFVIFQVLFTYSLIATALSVKDTITFTSYRTEFLIAEKKKQAEQARIQNTGTPQ